MINSQPDSNPNAGKSEGIESGLWDSDFFVLCGTDRDELIAAAQQLIDRISSQSDAPDRGHLSLELFRQLVANPIQSLRLGIVASDLDELHTKLQRAIDRLGDPRVAQINDVSGIYFASEPMGRQGKTAFLLPGEGSQYIGMMSDITQALPDSGLLLKMCDQIYARRGKGLDQSASRFFQNPENLSQEELRNLEADLRRIDNAMFSVFIGDWIIYLLLERMNLQCDVVAGHSAGELAALMVTRCIDGTDEQFEQLSAGFNDLGNHRPEDANPSKLIALGKSSDVAQSVIDAAQEKAGRELEAFVAMHNCPHQSVIVGLADDMQLVEDEVVHLGLVFQQLALEQPYHTPLFQPYMRTLRKMFDEMPFQSPQVPIYSCTSAGPFPDDPNEVRQLTLAHWENPVRFTELINNLYEDGVRTFVEVGPRNNLCSFVEDILRGRSALILPTNVPRHSGLTQLNHVIARLLANDIEIDPTMLFEARGLIPAENSQSFGQIASAAEIELLADPALSPHTVSSPGTHVNMQSYLQVMDQFLDMQSVVMQQYLRSGRMSENLNASLPGIGRRKRGSKGRGRKPGNDVINPPSTFVDQTPSDDAEFPADSPPADYPLIGTIIEHVPQKSIAMQRIMDLNEDGFARHHTVGGRELSAVNPDKHGLPVVPMTFTLEMLCEVAQTLLPGWQVSALEDISLLKWLAYEGMLSTVQVNATVIEEEPLTDSEGNSQIRVKGELYQWREDGQPDFKRPAATATIIMHRELPPAPLPATDALQNRRATTIDVETLYKNLFHGPLFQGVNSVVYADNGSEGIIESQPRSGLFASCSDPEFIFDPVLMDIVMHPMCAWHLEQEDQSGRILLPMGIERIEFFGHRPDVGKRFISRTINARETTRQFAYHIEVIDESGNLWCRMTACTYWRFYLPFSEFNFHGPKNVYMLSNDWDEILALPDVAETNQESYLSQLHEFTCCRRLEVPTDLQNPTMLPVGAIVTLGESEFAEFNQLDLPAFEKAQWLFRRVAAKDAIRVLWHKLTGERLFSADVRIAFDEHGRPVASLAGRETPEYFPTVVVAHSGMMIGAIASVNPSIGIAVRKLGKTPDRVEEIDLAEDETTLIASVEPEVHQQWQARLHCAKQAVTQAMSNSELADSNVRVVRADLGTGIMLVGIDSQAGGNVDPVFVKTTFDGSFAIATTLCLSERICNA